jgi:hypothetical protein
LILSRDKVFFPSPSPPNRLQGYWILEVLSLETKWQEDETDHKSPPRSGEDKNAWNFTSTSLNVFMTLCLRTGTTFRSSV